MVHAHMYMYTTTLSERLLATGAVVSHLRQRVRISTSGMPLNQLDSILLKHYVVRLFRL